MIGIVMSISILALDKTSRDWTFLTARAFGEKKRIDGFYLATNPDFSHTV